MDETIIQLAERFSAPFHESVRWDIKNAFIAGAKAGVDKTSYIFIETMIAANVDPTSWLDAVIKTRELIPGVREKLC